MKAFGSSEQSGKPSAARGCPSLTEPFSTLGTDIKAASTPLKCSDIHRHKDTHTHARARAHAQHTKRRKYVCHGHTGETGGENNFLSKGIRKTRVERGSAEETGERDKGCRSVKTHQCEEGYERPVAVLPIGRQDQSRPRRRRFLWQVAGGGEAELLELSTRPDRCKHTNKTNSVLQTSSNCGKKEVFKSYL